MGTPVTKGGQSQAEPGSAQCRRLHGWNHSDRCVPVTGVFALPEVLPLVDSAILGCDLHGLRRCSPRSRHEVGERVAVVGVGGVGSNMVQLARAFGAAQVIAIDVRQAKLKAATAVGATAYRALDAGEAVGRAVIVP